MALQPGKKAPSFELTEVKGGKQSLPRLNAGEVALFAFYKENCPTCQLALPFLEKLYQYHQKDQKVHVFSVAQENKNGAQDFMKRYGISMPTALDSAPYEVSTEYQLGTVPAAFLVKEGNMIEQTTEGFVKKEYEALAGKLGEMAGKPPAPIFQGVNVPELKPG